jgi:hypothetical protein
MPQCTPAAAGRHKPQASVLQSTAALVALVGGGSAQAHEAANRCRHCEHCIRDTAPAGALVIPRTQSRVAPHTPCPCWAMHTHVTAMVAGHTCCTQPAHMHSLLKMLIPCCEPATTAAPQRCLSDRPGHCTAVQSYWSWVLDTCCSWPPSCCGCCACLLVVQSLARAPAAGQVGSSMVLTPTTCSPRRCTAQAVHAELPRRCCKLPLPSGTPPDCIPGTQDRGLCTHPWRCCCCCCCTDGC